MSFDLTLRECPFCGCPAEIVDTEPYQWAPKEQAKMIRCINEYGCPGHNTNIKFLVDCEVSAREAREAWNTRKRKNKNYFVSSCE